MYPEEASVPLNLVSFIQFLVFSLCVCILFLMSGVANCRLLSVTLFEYENKTLWIKVNKIKNKFGFSIRRNTHKSTQSTQQKKIFRLQRKQRQQLSRKWKTQSCIWLYTFWITIKSNYKAKIIGNLVKIKIREKSQFIVIKI